MFALPEVDRYLFATYPLLNNARGEAMCGPETEAERNKRHRAELKRWKRFVDAARLEKKWIHERMQIFLMPQSLLFAAYAVTYHSSVSSSVYLLYLRFVVCALGSVVSASVFVSVCAAVRMHCVWNNEIVKMYRQAQAEGMADEYTFGRGPGWPARYSTKMPLVVIIAFFLGWLSLLAIHTHPVAEHWLPIVSTVLWSR